MKKYKVKMIGCTLAALFFCLSCGSDRNAAYLTIYCVNQYGAAIPGLEVKFADDSKISATDGKLTFKKRFAKDTPVFIEPKNHEKMGLVFLGPGEILLRKKQPRQEIYLNFYRKYRFNFTTMYEPLKKDSTSSVTPLENVEIKFDNRRLGESDEEGKLNNIFLSGFHPNSLSFKALADEDPVKLEDTLLTNEPIDFKFNQFEYDVSFVFKEKKKEPHKSSTSPGKNGRKIKVVVEPAKIKINTRGRMHTVEGVRDGVKPKRVRKDLDLLGNKWHTLTIKISGKKPVDLKFRAASGGEYYVRYSGNFLILEKKVNGEWKDENNRVKVK